MEKERKNYVDRRWSEDGNHFDKTVVFALVFNPFAEC